MFLRLELQLVSSRFNYFNENSPKGGYLIDRVFGIRLGAIVFSTLVLAGQIVFALGALYNKVWLMDVGRFIFGYFNTI